jgi:hypothetical protein
MVLADHTTRNVIFLQKKSAGIPEDFAADFVLRSYFLRILHQESFPADFKFSEKSAGISKD